MGAQMKIRPGSPGRIFALTAGCLRRQGAGPERPGSRAQAVVRTMMLRMSSKCVLSRSEARALSAVATAS